jgi:hypothetical protein
MKILIISSQDWGSMYLSKHHYSVALTELGHEVYYLEPFKAGWKWNKRSFKIKDVNIERLKVIEQTFNLPYNIKFHSNTIYNFFIKHHINKIETNFGSFDLIFSFDLTNSFPLEFFSKRSKKIFFAADWPLNKCGINAANKADLLVSVSQEILNQYKNFPISKQKLLSHGVADYFIIEGLKPFVKYDNKIRVGLSGNFLRPDLNRIMLLEIIKFNNNIIFEFFGAIEPSSSNLGGFFDLETLNFIDTLKEFSNVILHGIINPKLLSSELRRMDLFLICYDINKDQSKGTNYHKISEFLVYKRPIVSNFVSSYIDNPYVFQSKDENGIVDVKKNFNALLNNGIFNLNYDIKLPLSYKNLVLKLFNELSIYNIN